VQQLSTPSSTQSWMCPKLSSLGLEGCTTFELEGLHSFVELRLPAHCHAFPGTLTPPSSVPYVRPLGPVSLASVSAAAHAAAMSSASSSASAVSRPGPSSKVVPSASAFAANVHILYHILVMSQQRSGLNWSQRLQSIELIRCHWISKEMVQWLRMYVADVKCDTAKSVWNDSSLI
jgi:hypothetical protein